MSPADPLAVPDGCPDKCDCPAWNKSHRIRVLESRAAAREAEVQAHMEARFAAEERAGRLEEALRAIAGHECTLVRDRLFLPPGDCSHINERHPAGSCASCVARAALAPPPGAEKGAPPC